MTSVGGSSSAERRRATLPASRAANAPSCAAAALTRSAKRRPELRGHRFGQRVVGRLVHAVHDQAAERHPRLAQLAVEEDRLLHRIVARRRHDQERRRRVLEQRADRPRPLGEAVDHPAQRAEEPAQIAQQVDARDLLHRLEDQAGAAPQQPGGLEEDADRAALEEAREPPGRVEEVQRVARRRRVEDEHVERAGLVELVELRDRGELLRAGHRGRELLVDPVLEHLVARALVRREPLDQLVERPLGVEHHRPQLALGLDRDPMRLVAELVEPERRRQPPGRVDRHDGDLQAPLGEPERDRRGGGGLAHASRAGADDHPLALEQGLEGRQHADVR